MKTTVIKNHHDIKQEKETVLVLGYFDGLHKGHQALFNEARKIADKEGLEVALLTFPESPKLAFVRYQPELLLHLMSPKERQEHLEALGVDALYLVDFTTDFAGKTAQEFIETYVTALKAKVLVAGFDYHFGCDRKEADDLADFFPGQVLIQEEVALDGQKISSTRIRQAIQKGDVEEVHQLLGYPLGMRGVVVHGDARGRTIGYPTANLAPLDRVMIPSDGVYVVDVVFEGQTYRGMASVGKNVTFDGEELRFEVNIFDFNRDIYGHSLEVKWLSKIRDMVKFDGIEALCDQLQSDQTIASQWKQKV